MKAVLLSHAVLVLVILIGFGVSAEAGRTFQANKPSCRTVCSMVNGQMICTTQCN